MKLGADSIYIELAGEAFELRPSLRASLRLVRRHSLPSLLAAVQAFNITIISDTLREAAIKPRLLLAEIAQHGLGSVRNRLTGPLAQFVLAIAGIDPDDTTPAQPSTEKPSDPEQLFTDLFKVGTGWLGWTPEETWNATPAEIIAARNGRTDLIMDVLQAVYGPAEKGQAENKPSQTVDAYSPEVLHQIEEQGHDPAFDRKAYAAFKAKVLS
jgi:Conserved hypothetical phage protein (DUF2376).